MMNSIVTRFKFSWKEIFINCSVFLLALHRQDEYMYSVCEEEKYFESTSWGECKVEAKNQKYFAADELPTAINYHWDEQICVLLSCTHGDWKAKPCTDVELDAHPFYCG